MMRTYIGVAALAWIAACNKSDDAKPAAKPEPNSPSTVKSAAPSEAPAKPAAPTPAAAAPKLVDLDASSAGDDYKGWKLSAPEGAKAKDSFGALEVKAGDGFQLEVHSGKLDMAARKKEIADNTMNKLKRYVVESPDAIVYESGVGGGSEFHFLAAAKVGDTDVSCEDVKGPTYTQAQIETMLASCKTLKK